MLRKNDMSPRDSRRKKGGFFELLLSAPNNQMHACIARTPAFTGAGGGGSIRQTDLSVINGLCFCKLACLLFVWFFSWEIIKMSTYLLLNNSLMIFFYGSVLLLITLFLGVFNLKPGPTFISTCQPAY